MSLIAYLSVEGEAQGNLSQGATTEDSVGGSYQAGHEDEIMVVAWAHNVMIPRDPASGQPTGARVHNPLHITKYLDKSSPLLFGALCSAERLSCTLKVNRINAALGSEEHFYTIKLTGAVLVDVQSESFPTYQEQTSNYHPVEHLQFTYSRIEWIHEAAGTMAEDDWRNRRS